MNNIFTQFGKYIPLSTQRKENDFRAIQAVFDRMLEDFCRDSKGVSVFANELENLMITPSINILDNQDLFKIQLEVPGISSDNLKVITTNHNLTIKGEKSISHKNENQNYTVREIAYGVYQRTIPLPDSVDIARAKATFKDGTLTIEIPKKTEAMEQYRELDIESI